MWRRVTCAVDVTSGAVSTRNAAKDRSAWSGSRTLRSQDERDLVEVAAHRVHDQRTHPELLPGRQQQRPAHRRLLTAGAQGGRRRLARRSPQRPFGIGKRANNGQVQVDPGRFDRGVPGLGLDRFQGHPGLTEPGQTGVAQFVTRRMGQAGARRAPAITSSNPFADNGFPRLVPLRTTKTRSVFSPGGRSASR